MKIKKVVISQPEPQNEKSPYMELAQKYGLKIDFRPFIHVEGVSSKEFRQQKINILDHTAVIFTSKTAVDHFFRICEEVRVTVPETMKYFCITESVALYLQKYIVYRKRKIFYGNNTFADLLEIMQKHKEEKYLLSLSDVHKPEIPYEELQDLPKHVIDEMHHFFEVYKALEGVQTYVLNTGDREKAMQTIEQAMKSYEKEFKK